MEQSIVFGRDERDGTSPLAPFPILKLMQTQLNSSELMFINDLDVWMHENGKEQGNEEQGPHGLRGN